MKKFKWAAGVVIYLAACYGAWSGMLGAVEIWKDLRFLHLARLSQEAAATRKPAPPPPAPAPTPQP